MCVREWGRWRKGRGIKGGGEVVKMLGHLSLGHEILEGCLFPSFSNFSKLWTCYIKMRLLLKAVISLGMKGITTLTLAFIVRMDWHPSGLLLIALVSVDCDELLPFTPLQPLFPEASGHSFSISPHWRMSLQAQPRSAPPWLYALCVSLIPRWLWLTCLSAVCSQDWHLLSKDHFNLTLLVSR